jgi:hypothetical protein
MNYEQPPGHVACEEVGTDAPAAEKAASAARLRRSGYTGSTQFTGYVPDALGRFDPAFDYPPAFNSWFRFGCLFLHGRRSPAGHDRLVRVDISSANGFTSGPTFTSLYTLGGVSIIPASLLTKPHQFPLESGALDVRWDTDDWKDPSFFRFFTGRPDPADPSHFTIDYEVGNALHWPDSSDPAPTPSVIHGTIDGWLRDDETVLLKQRGGKIAGNTWLLNDPLESPTTVPVAR